MGSNRDILNQSRFLLNQFVHDRMEEDGVEGALTMEQLQGSEEPTGPPMEFLLEIKRALKYTAEDIRKDAEAQKLMSRVRPDQERAVLIGVARKMLEGGSLTWGKVVSLFCFAYELCVRAVSTLLRVREIINMILEFMKERVVDWIRQSGGWQAITSVLRTQTQTRNFYLAAAAGVTLCIGIYLRKYWF